MGIKQKPSKGINLADLELLTPGSTWNNNRGRAIKVLFLTNGAVPEAARESHPPQVVYANEQDQVFSREVSDFLDNYKFYNVDPALEARLGSLFAFDEASLESTLDAIAAVAGNGNGTASFEIEDDTPMLNASEGATAGGAEVATDTADEEGDTEGSLPLVTYQISNPGFAPLISPETLSKLTLAYSREPQIADSSVLLHKITFKTTPEVTPDVIRRCFSPSEIGNNAVFLPTVVALNYVVEWDATYGVYPSVDRDGQLAVLILGTSVEVSVDDGEPAVQAQAQPAVGSNLSVG